MHNNFKSSLGISLNFNNKYDKIHKSKPKQIKQTNMTALSIFNIQLSCIFKSIGAATANATE